VSKFAGPNIPNLLMKQITFADAEYSNKRKQTRKELFLEEMEQVVPWKGLTGLIEPHYPRGEGGGGHLIH